MKQRIALQVKNARLKDNIKLGAGGIREIEFFGQLFQLIRGGVEPALQAPGILQVLHLLADHDCIDMNTRDDLILSYRFLRMVENRLQEYQDLQTHDIPEIRISGQSWPFPRGLASLAGSRKNWTRS